MHNFLHINELNTVCKMAIVFTQSLDVNRLLFAYNNHIIRYTSDTTTKTISKSEISGLDFFIVLYPNPSGSFYFNFKEYLMTSVNTKNFVDDVNFLLNELDNSTAVYDVSNGHFKNGDIEIKIIFSDASEETTTLNIHTLAAVTQLESFNDDKIELTATQFVPLIPSINRNELTTIKVWKGYPFEFTCFSNDIGSTVEITNTTTVNDLAFEIESYLTSIYLSDGSNKFLGLQTGWNKIDFTLDGTSLLDNKMLIKYDSQPECGIYVKFINRFGRWSYWLFSKHVYEKRSTKYMGEIENDFENIEDTQSPTLQIGKISDSSLRVAAMRVEPEFCIQLDDIFDSPKIMIFNGKVGEVNTYKNWFETKLKTSSYEIRKPNQRLKNYILEFDNPQRNTITL